MDPVQRLVSLDLVDDELDRIHALILEGVIKPDSFQFFNNDEVLRDVLLRYLARCKYYQLFRVIGYDFSNSLHSSHWLLQ